MATRSCNDVRTQSIVVSGKVVLGRVTGVFGLRGWVKVHSDTNPRENILDYRRWWLCRGDEWFQVSVRDGRRQARTLVAHLEGFDDPESAATLTGATIGVRRSELPAVADGEYYWADLVGLNVRTVAGETVGRVARLFETGANDVLVVDDTRSAGGSTTAGKEVLVPWIAPDVITEVDLGEGWITIDWDPDF